MFGFPWFLWNRKSLSVGWGVFVVLDKLERNLLGKWIRWRSKVELKVFRWKFHEIYRIDSLVLELFDVFFGFLVFEALRGNLRWNFWVWNEENEWSSQFTEFLSKSSRIFSEFLAMISTTLWLTWIDKNFSVCWTARLIWLRFWNEMVEFFY